MPRSEPHDSEAKLEVLGLSSHEDARALVKEDHRVFDIRALAEA